MELVCKSYKSLKLIFHTRMHQRPVRDTHSNNRFVWIRDDVARGDDDVRHLPMAQVQLHDAQ